jgi:hypothetical protein
LKKKKEPKFLNEWNEEAWTEKEALLEHDLIEKQLFLVCSQLAPILDRSGRAMVDVAPHFAMLGQNIKIPVIGSPLERAASPFNGIYNRFRHGPDLALPDPIARFLDPLHFTRSSATERSTLSSLGRNLQFEVPVMLNPGELLSTNSRQNGLVEDNNVHLHINAQVHMPGKY